MRRVRAYLKPEVRQWLDGFGVFFAITLFFCFGRRTDRLKRECATQVIALLVQAP